MLKAWSVCELSKSPKTRRGNLSTVHDASRSTKTDKNRKISFFGLWSFGTGQNGLSMGDHVGFRLEGPITLPGKLPLMLFDNPKEPALSSAGCPDCFNGYALVYTDGSKKQEGVGGAFLVPETNLTGSYKLPEIYSSFSAEAFAINKALDTVCTTKNKICILTDSLSVLKFLESNLTPFDKIHPIVRQIKNKLQIEQSKGSSIVFIWTKAHSGITHNEPVDNLAKAAINNKDFSTHSLCLSDCINFLKKNTRDEWATSYQQYRSNTSTQYATIQKELPKRPWFYDLKISIRYAVMYTRLRFGHGRYPACTWYLRSHLL
nr:unnamed protein product [Callosobruchus analis]